MLVASGLCHRVRQRAVLDDCSLTVEQGESVAIIGPSGVGKTTLLACMAGVVVPDAGRLEWEGRDLAAMPARDRDRVRLEHFGFVFQFGELLPELTVVENVELPLRLAGRTARVARRIGMEMLERLAIASLADELPETISGGESQRVAVARALVHRPEVVFGDEPTGSLDGANRHAVMQVLLDQCREIDATAIIVTHDATVAAQCDRVLEMSAGRLATVA